MSEENDDKKTIVLGIIAILIGILIIVFAIWLFTRDRGVDDTSGGGETSTGEAGNTETVPFVDEVSSTTESSSAESEEIATPPESEEQAVPKKPATNQQWRDEVVTVASIDSTASDDVPEISYPSQVEQINTQPTNNTYEPPPPLPLPPTPIFPPASSYALYPTLPQTSFSSCGSTRVSITGSFEDIVKDLANDSETICLGEAIADDCEASRVRFTGTGINPGYAYVMERPDGVCSLGTSFDYEGNSMVSLCPVADVMNVAAGENKTFDEWQDDFERDPGDTLADAYAAGLGVAAAPPTDVTLDCQLFAL